MKGNAFVLLFILISLFFPLSGFSQKATFTKQESQRMDKLWSLNKYVKNTMLKDIKHEELFGKYVTYFSSSEDTLQSIDPRREELFKRLLKELDTTLDTMTIEGYEALPWNKFVHAENLPRMLWQDEPLTHLFGQPLADKNTERDSVAAEGRKQLANTLVIFKKDSPAIPRFFILFDKKTNKIVSWKLLNQGGLHYFLPF